VDMQPVGEALAELFDRLANDARARCQEAEAARNRGADAAGEKPLRPRSGPEGGASRKGKKRAGQPAKGKAQPVAGREVERREEAMDIGMEMDCLAVRFTPTNQPIFMLKGGKY
jgi:hypothetical protein